jgi:hypothetical protein
VEKRIANGDRMRFQRESREKPVSIEDVLSGVEIYLLVPRCQRSSHTDAEAVSGDYSPSDYE